MKLWKAFNIFCFLLKAREWYIIADNPKEHLIDVNINFGKFLQVTENHKRDVFNQESLLKDAKDILNHE